MRGRFALIIEDDKDEAIIFAKALQSAGFETEIIQDGDTALVRLAAVVPDVVLLDLHLPGVAGKDVLQCIRGDARLAATPVIVVTGDPLAAESLRDRTDLVLIKPISFSQLSNLAARLIPTAPLSE
jgi:DNA-binding response OmpR family regulator